MNYYPQIERKLDPTGFGIYRPVGNRLTPYGNACFAKPKSWRPAAPPPSNSTPTAHLANSPATSPTYYAHPVAKPNAQIPNPNIPTPQYNCELRSGDFGPDTGHYHIFREVWGRMIPAGYSAARGPYPTRQAARQQMGNKSATSPPSATPKTTAHSAAKAPPTPTRHHPSAPRPHTAATPQTPRFRQRHPPTP